MAIVKMILKFNEEVLAEERNMCHLYISGCGASERQFRMR